MPTPNRVLPSVLAAALLLPTAALAVDPVGNLAVARSGDDLVISWSPPGTPVDGYRVYKATDPACSSLSLVYQGTATSYAAAGALSDPAPAIYGVAAYLGADEGLRSEPIYSYRVTLPYVSGAVSASLVSFPEHLALRTSQDLCLDIHGGVARDNSRVNSIYRSDAINSRQVFKFCSNTISPYDLRSGEAYSMKPRLPVSVAVWGIGDSAFEHQFSSRYQPPPPTNCDGDGIYFVSLPWDHAYADLSEIAAEVPQAVKVQVQDPSSTDCAQYYIGLSRATTSDPWSGSNIPLADRRGQGIVIGVESPATWRPRRLCSAFGGPVQPVNVPPVADAGGPYNSTLCNGGVIGIWLDGSASFDPDHSGTLSYQWTSTCGGTIADPTAAITPAMFDCDPCDPLSCSAILTVTDGLGAGGVDVEPVVSRQVITCVPPIERARTPVTAGGSGQRDQP